MEIKKRIAYIGLGLATLSGIVLFISQPPESTSNDRDSIQSDKVQITQREAIRDHWNEIKEYASGSGVVNACYNYGDNCYTLKIELESGKIIYMYFPNGGYLTFDGVELDNEGIGEATSDDNRDWDFNLDLDNNAIFSAIDQWANDNSEYSITYDSPDPQVIARMEEQVQEYERKYGRSIKYFADLSAIQDKYQGPLDKE